MSIELVMPSNHLILRHPLLLLPSIFPIIRVFSNETAHFQWVSSSGGQTIGASASATVLSMNIQGWSPLGLAGLTLLSKGLSRVFFSTAVWRHQFFNALRFFFCPVLTSVHWETTISTVILLFLKFQLEDNCFTMFCWFVPYNNMNQAAINKHVSPLSWTFLPLPTPSHPLVVIEHWDELPVLYSDVSLAVRFTYGSVDVSVLLSQFIPPPSSPHYVHKSVLCVYLSIPALQIGSSERFF